MRNTRLLRILIASPGDVSKQRDQVEAAIRKVERQLGNLLGISLQPVRWEVDAHPGFHIDGPQALIDTFLKIEDADIVVGIFAARFGTPVHDAESGTEHEFKKAYECWKVSGKPEIMMYFQEKPNLRNQVSDLKQYMKVIEFRDSFPKEGLWWSYKLKDFQSLVEEHLSNKVQEIANKDQTVVTGSRADNRTNPITPNVLHSAIYQDYNPASVFEHLGKASVETVFLRADDLQTPGTIIWPIVPRRLVTAIHQGQTEIIRLLVSLGWQIQLLIADCGGSPIPEDYSTRFCQLLQAHLQRRGLKIWKIVFMSRLYKPEFQSHKAVQELFKRVSTSLSLRDLLALNEKSYTQEFSEKLSNSSTLNCLRPALTLAAVIYLASEHKTRSIIVAGFDEEIQWKKACSLQDGPPMSAIMNPKLNVNRRNQLEQGERWPSWVSQGDLYRSLLNGTSNKSDPDNLAWWLFTLHAFLPSYPSSTVRLGNKPIDVNLWVDRFVIPDVVDIGELANCVWPILEATQLDPTNNQIMVSPDINMN